MAAPCKPDLDGGGGRQRLGEADHAHVVCVLLHLVLARVTAAVQAGQTRILVLNASARMLTRVRLGTGIACMLLKERENGHFFQFQAMLFGKHIH